MEPSLAEVAVPGQHSVRIKPLDNVDRAVHSSRQQSSGHEDDQDLHTQLDTRHSIPATHLEGPVLEQVGVEVPDLVCP